MAGVATAGVALSICSAFVVDAAAIASASTGPAKTPVVHSVPALTPSLHSPGSGKTTGKQAQAAKAQTTSRIAAGGQAKAASAAQVAKAAGAGQAAKPAGAAQVAKAASAAQAVKAASAKQAAKAASARQAAKAASARQAAKAARARQVAKPASNYLIYDSVTPSAIPGNHEIATYANGRYAISGAQVANRGKVLWIDTRGSDPDAAVLDVEPGDATPWLAAQWTKSKLSAHPGDIAILYTMRSEWGATKAAVGKLPASMGSRVRWWIADPTGVNHLVSGSSATQWYWGTSYDISTATPDFES